MGTIVKDYSVIVVSQSEKLDRMSRTAVAKLGAKLRSGRAVRAEAKRFAGRVAAKPSILDVEILDVAGLADPTSNRPGEREPLVLHDGKFVPVTHTYLMVAGEHHIVAAHDLDARRDELVVESARRIAEDIFLGDAMMAAIDAADPDCSLTGMSSHSATCTVTLVGDNDGKIASKLPGWITVGEEDGESDAP
jgi:hypothetical protein